MVYRRERWKLNFGSTVQYVGTPDNALDFLQDSVGASRQRAYGHHFYTEETFYTGYQLLPALTLALPVKLMAKATGCKPGGRAIRWRSMRCRMGRHAVGQSAAGVSDGRSALSGYAGRAADLDCPALS